MFHDVRKVLTTLATFLALLGAGRAALATGFEAPARPRLACTMSDAADPSRCNPFVPPRIYRP